MVRSNALPAGRQPLARHVEHVLGRYPPSCMACSITDRRSFGAKCRARSKAVRARVVTRMPSARAMTSVSRIAAVRYVTIDGAIAGWLTGGPMTWRRRSRGIRRNPHNRPAVGPATITAGPRHADRCATPELIELHARRSIRAPQHADQRAVAFESPDLSRAEPSSDQLLHTCDTVLGREEAVRLRRQSCHRLLLPDFSVTKGVGDELPATGNADATATLPVSERTEGGRFAHRLDDGARSGEPTDRGVDGSLIAGMVRGWRGIRLR